MSTADPATPAPTIVVGYDGSAASRAAVELAIERVGTGRLIVVHAYHVPADHIGASYYEDMVATAADRAGVAIDELEADFNRLADIDYESDVIAGHPAEAICRVATHRRADEIVMGSRGLGRVRALLGSVAHDVIHQASCPVLVIPERVVEARGHQDKTVAAVS